MAPSRRLVLLHGFTQSGAAWDEVAAELSVLGWDVSAPDLPGHDSNPYRDSFDLPRSADELAGFGPATFVGYSLGARTLLVLADRHPEVVERALVIGPRLALENPRERSASDERLAKRIEQFGVDAFVDEWLQLEFNERIPESRRHRAVRKQNRPDGLACSLRNCGLANMPTVNPNVPMTVLIGEHDFVDVKRDAQLLRAGATLVEVPGVGHGIPFELEPSRFAALVDDYARLDMTWREA